MKALVIFESMYGNTRAIAQAVAEGLGSSGSILVSVVPVSAASDELIRQADLLVVGGPTHLLGMSRTWTRRAALAAAAKPESPLIIDPAAEGPGVRDWLAHLEGRRFLGAAFDTRLAGPATFTGRAAAGIARRLRRCGVTAVSEPQSFLVTRRDVLRSGETDRAREWGTRLSALATARTTGTAFGATLPGTSAR